MASQPVLLPWLNGMDRATGGPSEDASSFADMRNIVYFPGAVRLRPGLGDAVNELTDPVVCSVGVFQAYGLLVWCLYDGTDVNVVQTNLQGQSEVAVGTFGPLAAGAMTPPRFTFAEAYGILVIAHDEPNVALRFDTYRFDPADVGSEWDTIDASLDGGAAAPVVFRGVVQHLGAIWGWGYGSASDPDRPEVLRRSDPADPTVYVPEQYMQFGARLDPIIGCAPVQSSLGVFKGSSWYRLDGNTAATFSPQLVDPIIGLVSAQAIAVIDGVTYWWSPYGPRMTTGGQTEDISGPLDLTGPLPADLPALGPPGYCFTYYYPDNQKLGWAFPDPDAEDEGTVAYCVSLIGGPLRWSIDEIGRTVLCAVLASTGQASIAIDPGYADNVTVAGSVGGGPATATIGWTNEDCVGDEAVEVWGRMNAGAWSILTTVPVNLVTSPQTVIVTGGILTSGTLDVAIRHRRLGRYLSAYQDSSDPSMWPADSQGTGTITAVATPSNVVVAYDFTTGDVTVTWTNGDAAQDIEVQLSRGAFATPTVVVAKAPASTSHVFATGTGTPQNTARLAGLGQATGSASVTARVRHLIGSIVGTWANGNTVSITYDAAPDGAAVFVDTAVTRASVALGTQFGLEVSRPSSQVGPMTLRVTVGKVGDIGYGAIPANSGCATTSVIGGNTSFPAVATVTVHTATIATSDPDPYYTGAIAAVPCATCLAVGQLVGMGAASIYLGWTKAGDYAAHGTVTSRILPGSTAIPSNLVTCTV